MDLLLFALTFIAGSLFGGGLGVIATCLAIAAKEQK